MRQRSLLFYLKKKRKKATELYAGQLMQITISKVVSVKGFERRKEEEID
jgi:hypothetical protein